MMVLQGELLVPDGRCILPFCLVRKASLLSSADISNRPLCALDSRGNPVHVAVIMDGSDRWASDRKVLALVGYQRGVDCLKEIIDGAPSLGIRWLTAYPFPNEREMVSPGESPDLISVLLRYIETDIDMMVGKGVCVKFIGDREKLEPKLHNLITKVERLTACGEGLNLVVAANYDGRDEIIRASRAIARDVAAGVLPVSEVTEDLVTARMDTVGMPEPDLFVRTGGRMDTSGFLAWQSAYSEYEFTPSLWPDFTLDEFIQIVNRYEFRERRYGGVLKR